MQSLYLYAVVKASYESANNYFQGISRNNPDQNITDVAKLAFAQLQEEPEEIRSVESKARKTYPMNLNSFPYFEEIILPIEEFKLIWERSNNKPGADWRMGLVFLTDYLDFVKPGEILGLLDSEGKVVIENGKLEFGEKDGATDDDFYFKFNFNRETQLYSLIKKENLKF